MPRHIKLLSLLAAGSLMSTNQLAYADSLSDNQVVRDSNQHIIRSIAFNSCVRTKWEGGMDACAPKTAEARKPVPRTVLTSTEKTVLFDFDSSRLTPATKSQLDGVSRKLKTASDVKRAEIVGYADRIGSNSYNLQLSKKRAESVKNYLATQGYLNTRVAEVRGLGESRPTTHCGNSLSREQAIQCLSADRRVEVEIHYVDTKPTVSTY